MGVCIKIWIMEYLVSVIGWQDLSHYILNRQAGF